MALFGFDGSCEELRFWLEDQTALLQTLQLQADTLEAMQLKFEVQSPWSQGGISAVVSPDSCPPSSPCACLPMIHSCASILHVTYSPVWEEGTRELALNYFQLRYD